MFIFIFLFFLSLHNYCDSQDINKIKIIINKDTIFNIDDVYKVYSKNNEISGRINLEDYYTNSFDKINTILQDNKNYNINNNSPTKAAKDEYLLFSLKPISQNLIHDFKKDFNIASYKIYNTLEIPAEKPNVNNSLSLFASIAGTESFYWTPDNKDNGGKFSMKLAPLIIQLL